jgi:hypothetical protein
MREMKGKVVPQILTWVKSWTEFSDGRASEVAANLRIRPSLFLLPGTAQNGYCPLTTTTRTPQFAMPPTAPPSHRPVSKLKVALLWAFMAGMIAFWLAFAVWLRPDSPPAPESPAVGRTLVLVVIGRVFLLTGIAGYIVVLFTTCLTFDFSQPIWPSLKKKNYFANIFVPLLFIIGIVLTVGAFLSPLLLTFGLSPQAADILPFILVLGLSQMLQLWVLIWAPLETRAIRQRLLAQGLTQAQLKSAHLIGLSTPGQSRAKRFFAIEEDIGGLWIEPERLIYYGDGERFSITRDELVALERKNDAGSTTMLGGVAHVILHVRSAEGSIRQIRLHTEGLWTMGQKRRAMDELAEALERWREAPSALVAGQPPVSG